MTPAASRSRRSNGDLLMRSAAEFVDGAPIPVLLVNLASRRIMAVSDTLVALVGGDRATLVGSDATGYLVGDPNPALALLASGHIDGYETTRSLRYPNGRVATVRVWANAFDESRPPRAAAIVIDEVGDRPREGRRLPQPRDVLVLGTVDREWRVERVSTDVEAALGLAPSAFVGRSFLGAVHPADVAELLTGLGQAHFNGRSVAIRLRLRAGDGEWRWFQAHLAPLPDTAGFAFQLTPLVAVPQPSDAVSELQERLARIAYEARRAAMLTDVAALPAIEDAPELARLTAREWQVLAAVRGGARSADVARSLNLAGSTVRNHLTSIYQKLGVTSQVELIAMVSRAARDSGAPEPAQSPGGD